MLKILGLPTSTSFNFSCTETMRTYANKYSTLCSHYIILKNAQSIFANNFFFAIFISDFVWFYLTICNFSPKTWKLRQIWGEKFYINWISSTHVLIILNHFNLIELTFLLKNHYYRFSSCHSSHFTHMKTINQVHKVEYLLAYIMFSLFLYN